MQSAIRKRNKGNLVLAYLYSITYDSIKWQLLLNNVSLPEIEYKVAVACIYQFACVSPTHNGLPFFHGMHSVKVFSWKL